VPQVAYVGRDGGRHAARIAQQYVRRFRNRHPTGSPFAMHVDAAHPTSGFPAGALDTLVLPVLMCLAGSLVVLLALGMAFGAA